MSSEFGSLQVERLIVHEIPRRTAGQSINLRVTDVESSLDQKDKNFFSERIRSSLARTLHQAAFDSNLESPVPKFVFRILSKTDPKDDPFVSISQKIAIHLYTCQKGNNPPGVLVIAIVKISGKKALAILKLEKEEGMQFEPLEDANGLYVCNIQQLSNLMLTGGRVFKIGLFIEAAKVSLVTCYVSDKQTGVKPDNEIAKFFLEDFLGCYLLESSEGKTKKFFNACQDFINDRMNDPEKKKKYEIALLAMIQSNQEIIDPLNFANDHLEIDDRQNFIDFLSTAQVSTSTFEKSTNSIKNAIKFMHLSFKKDDSSIVSLSGNPTFFTDIEITQINENRVQVKFEAEFGKVGK